MIRGQFSERSINEPEMRMETINVENIALKKIDKRNILDVIKALKNNLISPAIYNPE